MPRPRARSTNSAPAASGELLGSTEPRLWTPPLRELTPDTSYGFDVIDFSRDVLGTPLDPWQERAAIRGGELLVDGRPRFRTLLILAPRQNGKTLLGKAFLGYWLAVESAPLVLGTSTDRKYAKRTWNQVIDTFKQNAYLSRLPRSVRLTLGEESFMVAGAEYIFAANNGNAARSTTLYRWLCDELREHTSWDTWSSASFAMNAVPGAQTVVLTNQCDDSGVVLDSLRAAALRYIETGDGDPRLGLIEHSAPDGADPADPAALAQANPNYGRRIDPEALIGAARRAVAAGGKELADFRTEVLCQRVRLLDPAIDPGSWLRCRVDGDLFAARSRVALCLDVAPDLQHATLVAAAVVEDGRVRVEVVKAWDGKGCTNALRGDLPDLLARVKPQVLGWLPSGPAAALAADLADRKEQGWPPRGVTVAEIRSEVPAVAMGFAELVTAGKIAHSADPLLNAHVAGAERLRRGDVWVFSRRGAGHVDAAYAAAGAVWLARTLPPPPKKPLILVARQPQAADLGREKI